jgi:hypothetical protein
VNNIARRVDAREVKAALAAEESAKEDIAALEKVQVLQEQLGKHDAFFSNATARRSSLRQKQTQASTAER